MDIVRVRRALISVSDKLGLGGFARALHDAGVDIYSTGGTARFLARESIPVREISDYTQFPEMMDGRLKTLHPRVFGGILGRRDEDDDAQAMREHGIEPFDLVAVNLYPFEATVGREDVTDAEAIEQIDIGGPSLLRAAAKNHAWVTVATGSEQYSSILEEVQRQGGTSLALRRALAAEAFARTAAYDRAIVDYFSEVSPGDFPSTLNLTLQRKAELRYGENPHQRGGLYRLLGSRGANVVSARQLHGKELSYNNLLDLDSALAIVRRLPDPSAVVIKHNNPCGAASADSLERAASRALEGDPLSAFGSVLGFNRTVDAGTAEILCEPGRFIEAIVAPDFAAAAVGLLTTRPKWKNNVRLLQVGTLNEQSVSWTYRHINGGMLVQQSDELPDDFSTWETVTRQTPSPAVRKDLEFGWSLSRYVKSNAIVVCKDRTVCGVGAGQMSRVDSVEIALRKAGDRAQGAVVASDAFFPFPDSIQRAAEAGVVAVVQPGGSKNDDEVIAACDQYHIAMTMTGRRHFRH